MPAKSATTFVLTLSLAVVGCQSSEPPDELSFMDSVVDVTVKGVQRAGKIVVIDHAYLPEQPSGLVDSIKQRLSADGIEWLQGDLRSDPANMRGEWDWAGSEPVNRTHVLLSVSVSGGGAARTVQWNYTCGPLCGYGENVNYRWDGHAWQHETAAVIRY